MSLYQEDHDGSVGHLQGVVGSGVTQVRSLSSVHWDSRIDQKQVQFHPLSPTHLFVASRRSDIIQVYDLRNPTEQVSHLARKGDTNQRLWFDLDPWGRYIATGDQVSPACSALLYASINVHQDGKVGVWDINPALADPAPVPLFSDQICKGKHPDSMSFADR